MRSGPRLPRSERPARRRPAWGRAWLLALFVSGCGAVAPRPTRARLLVVTVPPGASVYVDERFAGSGRLLARRPLWLRPGHHLVTVEADGYFPHDLEVDLPAGLTRLRVALRPVPP